MSDGYKPYASPDRDEFIKKATYEELREALKWANEAEAAAADEVNAFAAALGEMLANTR